MKRLAVFFSSFLFAASLLFAAHTFDGGYNFATATGLLTGQNLEDLVELATPRIELTDNSSLTVVGGQIVVGTAGITSNHLANSSVTSNSLAQQQMIIPEVHDGKRPHIRLGLSSLLTTTARTNVLTWTVATSNNFAFGQTNTAIRPPVSGLYLVHASAYLSSATGTNMTSQLSLLDDTGAGQVTSIAQFKNATDGDSMLISDVVQMSTSRWYFVTLSKTVTNSLSVLNNNSATFFDATFLCPF